MYPLQTTLERIEPLSTEDAPNPLDRIRILAISPVKTASAAEWGGQTGDHYIVQPLEEFGPSEVMPFAQLQAEYTVLTYGDEDEPVRIELDKRRELLTQRPSPEETFAKAARENAKPKRGRPAAVKA